MPETAMYKNDGTVLSEHNIRLSGKTFYIETIPKPFGKQIFSHDKLRARVLALDAAHDVASFLQRKNIGHNATKLIKL